MSDMSRDARRAMRAKAYRLASQTTGTVDASDYGPEETENADIKTGMRPISRRAYKKGGKVEGRDAAKNAGKKPRKAHHAKIVNFDKLADVLVNRDVKSANQDREGIKHVGGLKRGGRAEKASGGEARMKMGQMAGMGNRGFKRGGEVHSDEKEDRALVRKMVDKSALTGKRSGGRTGKSVGGVLKGLAGSGMLGLAGLGISSLLNKDDDNATSKKRGGSIDNGERPKGGRIARKEGGGNWIAGAIKHPGALHKELHVPEGKKIPERKLEKAEHSDNPKLARRARLAETLKGMPKKGGGSVDNLLCNTGGRMPRKSGGRAKGKTDINILISAGPKPEPTLPAGIPPMPPVGGPPMIAPKPNMPPQMPPQMAAPVPPQPMPRKTGGRAQRAGAGSGLGRLEKTEIAKRTYHP